MPCAGFPRRHRPAPWRVLLALGMSAVLFAAREPTAASQSFVYCLKQDGLKVFAGREESDGNLLFGLSVWSPAGQNISLFGTAHREGQGWQFVEDPQAATAELRCRLDIVRGGDDSLHVKADPDANCQSHGGVNAEIGTVQFPSSAYEGAVTTELDDPEAFQKAGKCAGASG
jgi:hypothetical protein